MFKKIGIKSIQRLMQYFIDNFNYGFVYKNKIFTNAEPDFYKKFDKFYKIRLGEDLIKHKYGICWDFCELERLFFLQNNIEHECYFIESFINREEGGPTHAFTLFKQKNKWFWFEYSWSGYCGIWEYNSKDIALQDILLKFEKYYNRKKENIRIYKTSKVTKRLNSFEFVEHCLKGDKINY